MPECVVVVRRASLARLAWSLALRLVVDWGSSRAGSGWPPSYVDLTFTDASATRTLAGPMEAHEAEQLAVQVKRDLDTMDGKAFSSKYLS
jgi:hypothetical protein